MALKPFTGNTFLAFTDICGFTKMMDNNNAALEALNKFYSIGYWALYNQNPKYIEGLFISDSGILFATGPENDDRTKLSSLLKIVAEINNKMLDNGYMLTTSIAYGDFTYNDKIEFLGIDKNPVYGNAYVDAYKDTEKGKPKLEPGQCRILGCDKVKEILANSEWEEEDSPLKLVRQYPKGKFSRYYWNIKNIGTIERFDKEYKEAKYTGMLKILKNSREDFYEDIEQ